MPENEELEEIKDNYYYGGFSKGFDYSKVQILKENLTDLKDFYKTTIKALFTYPKTTKNNLEYTYHIPREVLNLIKKAFRKRILKKARKERAKAFISWQSQ